MKKFYFFYLISLIYFLCKPSVAQVISDISLPNNSNINNLNDTTTVVGGTQVGSNLFHSFEKFSVPTNATVYFDNPDVENIFSRVTGTSISEIDGRIQANGRANVFLLNPNGILFGPNASLNLGGSFVATTANGIEFADGTQFSAVVPQNLPLLIINVPIGLQIGSNSGKIIVQNVGHKLTVEDPIFFPLINSTSLSGLQVQPGKTIALVGGDVSLEGGVLIAPGGKVEIGSVNKGLVRFDALDSFSWNISYSDVAEFKDVSLSQSALVNTSGSGNGSIYIQGDSLTLTDGSLFLNQNLGSTLGGTLNINTSNSIRLDGTTLDTKIAGGFLNQAVGSGAGGDILVQTRHLVLENGAQIVNSSLSNAPTGNISINASQSVQVAGFSPLYPEIISTISTGTISSGKAGDVTIKTKNLTAREGGIVASLTNGSGAAGSLYIEASDSVNLVGVNKYLSLSSGLTSSTNDSGNSGNVIVNTSKLSLQFGGTVSASTTSIGKAGDIFINASDSIEVNGLAESTIPSLIISSAQKVDKVLENLLNITTEPSGSSGNVNINTPQLYITNGGLVSVRNDGKNDAGTLTIVNSNFVLLNNGGSITAASASGGGGNILLQADNIQLDRGSKITTNVTDGNGDGGNININTSIISILRDSSVSADAVEGRGGDIQIDAQGFFLSPNSEITASSALGVNGTVQINTFDTQIIPTTTFPQEIVETPKITSTCQPNSNTEIGTFTITGTGGIPPNPDDMLSTSSGWHDRSTIAQGEDKLEEKSPTVPAQIIEAQGWRKNSDGTIVLTAEPTGEIALTAAANVGCNQASATKTNTNIKIRAR